LGKNKLARFAENATFSNMFQPDWNDLQLGFPLRGNWLNKYFENENPIILELGCGKGEYTVALAVKYPDRNFIGMDKKGARMWKGAKTTAESRLPNVAFVRVLAEHLPEIFAADELDEIWITFPEPQPNSPRIRKRFTSPHFLERYRKVLKPGGIIHLKTDNDELFEYTLGVIRDAGHPLLFATHDLYKDSEMPELQDVTAVQTFYEKMWLEQGLKIKYLRFLLQPQKV
jgi:tRNA (guanine-N7-)-methyltransferase